jgi:hypothetical protein
MLVEKRTPDLQLTAWRNLACAAIDDLDGLASRPMT